MGLLFISRPSLMVAPDSGAAGVYKAALRGSAGPGARLRVVTNLVELLRWVIGGGSRREPVCMCASCSVNLEQLTAGQAKDRARSDCAPRTCRDGRLGVLQCVPRLPPPPGRCSPQVG